MEYQHGTANCAGAVGSSIAALRRIHLTRKQHYASLLCIMALLATMWVCGNLSFLVHAHLIASLSPLVPVVVMACSFTGVSLLSLAAIVYFQLQADESDSHSAGE